MDGILNAMILLSNFVIVPGMAYGSQLAIGALAVTLIYAILRFSDFAQGDTMAFGTMATILLTWLLQSWGRFDRAVADSVAGPAVRYPLHNCSLPVVRSMGVSFLPSGEGETRSVDDRLGRGDVRLQQRGAFHHRAR